MGAKRAHQLYPSELNDAEWRVVKPLIPVKTGKGKGKGRPRVLSMRAVLNALFYLDRTGCQWRYLPKSYPAPGAVRYSYDEWRKDGTWQGRVQKRTADTSISPHREEQKRDQ